MTRVLAQAWSCDRMGKMRLGLQNEKGHRRYRTRLVTLAHMAKASFAPVGNCADSCGAHDTCSPAAKPPTR
jgi:hypothetical protein